MDAYQVAPWMLEPTGELMTEDDDDDTISDDSMIFNDTLPRILPIYPIQLTNNTGVNIEHLNEDCLLEIFASNSLTPMDLCSLAETCTRFKQITQRVFPKEYEIAHRYPGYEIRTENDTKFKANLQIIERILKNFGSHLSKLDIWSEDQELVNLVGIFCGNVTLNYLYIHGFKSIGDVKTHMNSIFQRLRQLRVSNCNFLDDVKSQNLNFNSLIELNIHASEGCVGILKQSFPKLEQFFWRYSHVYTKDSNNATHLYQFIRRHGHLKVIDVRDESVCRSGLLHLIDSTCKELDKLRIEGSSRSRLSLNFSTQGGLSKLKMLVFHFDYATNSENIALLQAVKSLEKIKISGSGLQYLDDLSQLQNLRELDLSNWPFDRIRWTMLPQLRKVHLWGYHYDMDFPNMIRQLLNLEDLEYVILAGQDFHYELKKDEVTEIGKIVEQRTHVLTLKFRFEFDLEEICNENPKLKLIPRNEFY